MTRKTYNRSLNRSVLRAHSDAGFTLLELIVSLGVAAVMFLMIDRIFNETQRAVTAGIKTGEIMVKAETIGDQLQRDAEIMLGPKSGASIANRGCLIIGQKLYRAVPVSDGNYTPNAASLQPLIDTGDSIAVGPAGRREDIRSDQITFFVDGGSTTKIPSLTPKDQSTLAADRHFQYGRVWYGHAAITKPDGTIGSGAFGMFDSHANVNAENLYANRWVLGRQNLLFRDSAYTFSGGEIYGSYTVSGIDIKPSTTVNVTNSAINVASPPPPRLYTALSDVCFQDLSTVWENLVNPNAYPTEPLGFSYLDNRLWVNRALTGGRQPNARAFTSAGMSQLHPLLSGNISDFIVEFAGDYDVTAGIDVLAVTLSGTDANGVAYNIPSESIKWYGFWFNNPSEGRRNPASPYAVVLPASYDATLPTVFKVTANSPTAQDFASTSTGSNESYYLGDAAPAATNADAVFVFRHDDDTAGTNKWPYLLRVRYRLHDDNGVIASTTDAGRTMGKWYEHIIRVPRP